MQKFRQRSLAIDASCASEYLEILNKRYQDSEDEISSNSSGLNKHYEIILNLLDLDELIISNSSNSSEYSDELGHNQIYHLQKNNIKKAQLSNVRNLNNKKINNFSLNKRLFKNKYKKKSISNLSKRGMVK